MIVATLRGEVGDLALGAGADAASGGKAVELTSAQRDALEILVAWGDPRAEAQRWIERAAQLHPDLAGPDQWVRVAYRVKAGIEG
jgi:hypothetical protein